MTSNQPLVSIICLCYNHEKYLRQSIDSALNQTYPNVEIIIVDDFSSDNSRNLINQIYSKQNRTKILLLEQNLGNTKAFNKGLELAKGDYIIDLSTDDVLHPDRVKYGIESFNEHDDSYGVNFTNSSIIDEDGMVKYYHYPIDEYGNAKTAPPEGDLYTELIQRYFISAPTMMVKREVFDTLGGYDENLTYEDFDFWVRSSRRYKYCYINKVLIQRRRTDNSMSTKHYVRKSEQMYSTFIICEKILGMSNSKEEFKALKRRVYYEMSQCIKLWDLVLLFKYLKFLTRI